MQGAHRGAGEARSIDVARALDFQGVLMNHEESVVRAFIVPTKRERYLGFLATPKGRAKIISQLAHFKDLNPKYMFAIPPNQTNRVSLLKLLIAKGAGKRCWVISETAELDGKETDLDTALKETVGLEMGTIISCVPGKLAYFEDEDGRCILQR
jgi:hypothetical protein